MSNPYADRHEYRGYRTITLGKPGVAVLCWCGWESAAGTMVKGRASLAYHIAEAVKR